MRTDDQAPARYYFSSAVGVLVEFERLGIEHVEVSNKRTIFNLDVLTGHLDTAQTIEVGVFDISPDLDTTTDPLSLIEHLIDELATNRERQD